MSAPRPLIPPRLFVLTLPPAMTLIDQGWNLFKQTLPRLWSLYAALIALAMITAGLLSPASFIQASNGLMSPPFVALAVLGVLFIPVSGYFSTLLFMAIVRCLYLYTTGSPLVAILPWQEVRSLFRRRGWGLIETGMMLLRAVLVGVAGITLFYLGIFVFFLLSVVLFGVFGKLALLSSLVLPLLLSLLAFAGFYGFSGLVVTLFVFAIIAYAVRPPRATIAQTEALTMDLIRSCLGRLFKFSPLLMFLYSAIQIAWNLPVGVALALERAAQDPRSILSQPLASVSGNWVSGAIFALWAQIGTILGGGLLLCALTLFFQECERRRLGTDLEAALVSALAEEAAPVLQTSSSGPIATG
jgi:hypothetical protein